MNLKSKLNFIEDVFGGLCRFVGLEQFTATVATSHTMHPNPKLHVTFHKDIDLPLPLDMMHETPDEFVHKFMKPITDSIQNSEAVCLALEEMKAEVNKVKEENSKLRVENDELKRFKDHFDVEYKLRHG